MAELSPARAVWTAFKMAECNPYLVDPRKASLAAALRAAAPLMECVQDHSKLLAIADELEGAKP